MKFSCPQCGQRIEAEESDAGLKGVCPTCEGAFEVPGMADAASAVAREAVDAASEQGSEVTKEEPRPVQENGPGIFLRMWKRLCAVAGGGRARVSSGAATTGRLTARAAAGGLAWWRRTQPPAKAREQARHSGRALAGWVGASARGLGKLGRSMGTRWQGARLGWKVALVMVALLLGGFALKNSARGARQRDALRQAEQDAKLAAAVESARKAAEETTARALAANDARWEQRLATERQNLMIERQKLEQTVQAERQRTQGALAEERTRAQTEMRATERRLSQNPPQQKLEIKIPTPPPRQEQCRACNGTGDVACRQCKGTGRKAEFCKDCKGQQMVEQRGFFSKSMVVCKRCEGSGFEKCSAWLGLAGCGGTGKTDCARCAGSGKVTLNN